jgi:hypothetical protein
VIEVKIGEKPGAYLAHNIPRFYYDEPNPDLRILLTIVMRGKKSQKRP